jgi:N-acetylmuramoyl-L-alanine amidase
MAVVHPEHLLLRPGDTGDAVGDVQRRLMSAGFDVAADAPAVYGSETERAVRAFQEARGLRVDGICGPQTWSSLVEAGYQLGDRLLYVVEPMLRGDDVYELQRALGSLGFDTGRVDGIFGPRTHEALLAFQRNAGVTSDSICGPATLDALRRVTRVGGAPTVAHLRELEHLRDAPRHLDGRRIAVGETGGLAALADAVGRALQDAGAHVWVLHHPDESAQATEANALAAEAFLAIAVGDEAGCATAFYATEGYESSGGRRLAELLIDELPDAELGPKRGVRGMRLAILRETRMTAVVCEIGPPARAVEHLALLASGATRALDHWARTPLLPDG